MRRILLASAALFLALWALKISGLQSAFHPDDSPETATAGALLGIQHAPGYPLPSIAGRLACLSFPGQAALAQNFASCFDGCLLVSLFFCLAWACSGNPWLALAVGLGMGFMPQLGYQEASAKGGIYTLNALLTLASLACFARSKKDLRFLSLGMLLWGLGMAGHYMSLILFAPAAFLWIWKLPRKKLLRSALFLLPGLSLYLYLPLRAALHPALNWGDPETLKSFWSMLSRAQYAGAQNPQRLAETMRLTKQFFRLLPDQLPWPCWLLALLGLKQAWQSEYKPLLLGLGLHWLAVVLYNNPPADYPWVINAFFLPDFIGLWWLVLLGARAIAAAQRRWLAPALALYILVQVPSKLTEADFSQDYLCYDYGRDLLETLPKNSVLLVAGGGDAFGVWYLQDVEQRRQDVVLLDVPLLSAWYLAQLRPQIPEIQPQWMTSDAVVQGLLQAKMSRPLYYSSHNAGTRGIAFGVVSLAPAPGKNVLLSPKILLAPWMTLRTRFLNDKTTPADGGRSELAQYYPLSAQALEAMLGHFNSPALNAYAKLQEQRFQIH